MNTVITYDYYTLDQARQIIAEENRQKAIRQAKRKARRKTEIIYYIKQKLLGLIMVVMGVSTPFIADGVLTVSLFILPLGFLLIFTKEKIM